MILYSANIGDKDEFRQPKVKHDGVEYVYFVDKKENYVSSSWDVREVSMRYSDTRLDAKWYKMHPHLLFPGETTIWIDGSYIPYSENPNEIPCSNGIVLFHHTTARNCLYAEAEFCLSRRIGHEESITRQIKEYKKQGMPVDFGLFGSGVLYRKPETVSFNEAWWEQVLMSGGGSSRDQISLPYVLWKNNMDFSVLNHKKKLSFFMKGGKHLFHGTKDRIYNGR